jgi:hypothetical protein
LDCLDQRTLAYRKGAALRSAIEEDLGGADRLSAVERQLTQRAAFLSTLIESWETEWLSGKRIDLPDLFAAINSQRRVLMSLGLARRPRDVTPTLQEIIDGMEEESEHAEENGDAENDN